MTQSHPKERPILFNGAMVRAILAGTKTQTRRIVKWRDPAKGLNMAFSGLAVERTWRQGVAEWVLCSDTRTSSEWRSKPTPCPYGQPGDRPWVRETFAHIYRDNAKPDERRDDDVVYKADHPGLNEYAYGTWKPSIHMPRWASRITLEITSVRVERLHEISEADAAAEGMQYSTDHIGPWSGTGERWWDSARLAFKDLWLSINGPESWGANPWVWVVEFKRMEAST